MMTSTPISATEFWAIYFRDAFLTLNRHGDGYAGRIYADQEHAGPPVGLLRDKEETAVQISFNALREYDYAGDGRFALLTKRPLDIGDAYEAVIQQTYPYRDRPPFGKRRMAELFSQIRLEFGFGAVTAIAPTAVEQAVRYMVDRHTAARNQPIAALAWFLGERRERSSSAPLLEIVNNSGFAPFARHRVHFTAVDAAFSALWKVNDKGALWNLIDLMGATTHAGKRKIAPLFERLLSTRELLSLRRCDEGYFEAGFWRRMLENGRNFTLADWDRFDANSLFWELRHTAVLRLAQGDIETFRIMANDEVETVRNAVRARFSIT